MCIRACPSRRRASKPSARRLGRPPAECCVKPPADALVDGLLGRGRARLGVPPFVHTGPTPGLGCDHGRASYDRRVQRLDVGFPSGEETCAAWLYVPDGDGRFPGVVLAHGWTGVREQRLDAYAERFAGAGLAALVFDYRHFGASAGEPRQLLDITRQLADWGAAIAFVRSRAEIDPGRVALWGTSFSGGHVMETAARDRQIAAVVAQVPFADGLRNLPSLGVALALRLVAAGLRDQIGAVLGRAPHMVPSVGPPGSVAVMTTPDAEPGFRAIDPPGSTWRNQAAARIALRVGSYRPGRHADRIAAPILSPSPRTMRSRLPYSRTRRQRARPTPRCAPIPAAISTSTSEPRSNERSPTKRSSSPITCSVPRFAPARAVRMDLGPRAGKLDLIAEAPPRGTQRHPMAKRLRSCRRRDSRRGELRT